MTSSTTHAAADSVTCDSVTCESCRATPLGETAAVAVTDATQGGPVTASVTGEIDLTCADQLATVLCSALDQNAPGVSLDLSGVTFFDCAAVHALERVQRHAERLGRRLVLERSSTAVDLVLNLIAELKVEAAAQPAKPFPVAHVGATHPALTMDATPLTIDATPYDRRPKLRRHGSFATASARY